MILRKEQAQTIAMVEESIKYGNKRIVIGGATGFGKTFILATLIQRMTTVGKKAVFAVPTIGLIDQTIRELRAAGVNHIGVMQGDHEMTDPDAPVQVATYQTLSRRELFVADLYVFDECHEQFQIIYDYMDAFPNTVFLGLSATPGARGMGDHWHDLVRPISMSELIDEGLLSEYEYFVAAQPDLSDVEINSKNEYVEESLAHYCMTNPSFGHETLNIYLKNANSRPTLVFCVNVAHARQVAKLYNEAGIETACVTADTEREQRALINQQLASGVLKAVTSVRTMVRGVDIKISCIVDAAPTRSRMLHVQKIGRGMRINPGTVDLRVLDVAGNVQRLGMPHNIRFYGLWKVGENEPLEVLPTEMKICDVCGFLFDMNKVLCPKCYETEEPSSLLERTLNPPKLVVLKDPEMVCYKARVRDDGNNKPLGHYISKKEFVPMAKHFGQYTLGKEGTKLLRFVNGVRKSWEGSFIRADTLNKTVPIPPSPQWIAWYEESRNAYLKKTHSAPIEFGSRTVGGVTLFGGKR